MKISGGVLPLAEFDSPNVAEVAKQATQKEQKPMLLTFLDIHTPNNQPSIMLQPQGGKIPFPVPDT
ncbi:hypothetical protein [Limnospira fusiformis]|uniref:hypothetical protein n=1 Tax=Limnospira fusiformis TaxID=54297 RepID=UPI00296FA6A7